jgi:hypothetical protein
LALYAEGPLPLFSISRLAGHFLQKRARDGIGIESALCLREERDGMIRITITGDVLEQRWVVQGRLVAPWVAELEKAWEKESRHGDGRRRVVDLNEVTLIDKRGEEILMAMRRAGAVLVACGLYTSHVVEYIDSQFRNK